MSRFVVGIDLGTTNCAVAYVDTQSGSSAIQHLPLAQVVGPGEVEGRLTLPSFMLLASEHEVPIESVALPWDAQPDAVVGAFARDRGAELSHRLVSADTLVSDAERGSSVCFRELFDVLEDRMHRGRNVGVGDVFRQFARGNRARRTCLFSRTPLSNHV